MQDLRIPVPIHWTPEHGTHQLSAEKALRKWPTEKGWAVPAEILFSIHIEPGVRGSASGTLTLCSSDLERANGPDWFALHDAYRHSRSTFGSTLAREMFLLPEHPWNIQDVSAVIGVIPRELRCRLFREAYSFSASLRRCRLLHVFLSTLSPDHPSRDLTKAMTSNRHHLDTTFKSTHHVALSSIAKMTLPNVSPGHLQERLPPATNGACLRG